MELIIIGGGQAAAQLIISLTQAGFEGNITLIGEEQYLPYQRPPLSKKFLGGSLDAERLFFRSQDFYDAHGIRLILGVSVQAIDRDARAVICSDGMRFNYDRLVFASGARARRLDTIDGLPATRFSNILDLRTIADAEAIRPYLVSGHRVVIIGAGFIGLEAAARAQQLGLEVVVVEAGIRPLVRGVHREISDFLLRVHAEAGVRILIDCAVLGFTGEDIASGVIVRSTLGEETLAADFVIVGIGVVPNVELAAAAGLAVDNGILVDVYGQTSDSDIFAAGDCTNHPNTLLGQNLRLESVHNAIEQAKTVAYALCGTQLAYCQIPWFWSDQYDIKLQMAGLHALSDSYVMRGCSDSGRGFALFHFKDSVLMCVEAVNRPAEFMAARRIINAGGRLTPELLMDETVSPRTWFKLALDDQ